MTNQRSTAAAPTLVDHQAHTFVVRMWWEPNDGNTPGEWRGSVEHLATRSKRYFRDCTALPELVTAMIVAPDMKAGEHSAEDL